MILNADEKKGQTGSEQIDEVDGCGELVGSEPGALAESRVAGGIPPDVSPDGEGTIGPLGRAWITTDTYDILRIATDLVSPIPEIDLQLEHMVIDYVPVEFHKRHVRLWLPESTALYLAYRGHRYERTHNFTGFQLFSVDSAEAIKDPTATKEKSSQ